MFKNKPQQSTENIGNEFELDFDLDAEEAPEAFSLIPKGKYLGVITAASKKSSIKTPGCEMVNIEFKITQGEYAGRTVYRGMVVNHPKSEQAVKIGRSMLKSAFLAAGVTGSNLLDLMNAQTEIEAFVGEQPAQDGYEPRNEVKSFTFDRNLTHQTALPQQSTKPGFLNRKK
jgi:hypothetical protein